MEVKDNYTKKELVEALVNTNNFVMRHIPDNKEFRIEGEEVVCYRVNRFWSDREISRYSFDEVILEVGTL